MLQKLSSADTAPTRSRTMRAAILTGAGALAVEAVALPEPGPGQVRVRMEGCGVCASNLVPWSGPDWMQFPTQPGGLGHEGWGIVDALGEGVSGLKEGERVATLFQNSYAEFDCGDASMVLPIPSALGGAAFPGEPLGCAMNIFQRSGIEAGQTVAVLGIGFLGSLLCRLASAAGATVIAISRRGFALDVARSMGAAHAIGLSDPWEILREVEALTGNRLCERVIEATGMQAPLDLAGMLVGERGRLVIAGYHQDGLRHVNMQQWNWRGIDVINAHERDPAIYMRGIAAAVEAVSSGLLQPAPLYTHWFPLERLGEALNMTRDRPDGFMKALVTMA